MHLLPRSRGGAQAFSARPASGGMPLPQSAAHPPFPPASLLRNGRKRSSVAYELRLRAVAEARREAALRLRMVALRVAIGLLALAATLSVTLIGASAKGARASSLGNLLFDLSLIFPLLQFFMQFKDRVPACL